VAGLDDRIRHLEFQLPEDLQDEAARLERREFMRAWLDELAAAKRQGREPASWARAISEDLAERRARES
jgi:hypothetical protein